MVVIFLFFLLIVSCRILSQAELCTENALRLSGRATPLEGRLEVCMNATWGGVCHENWNYKGAAVACRQLGFSYNGASALFNQASKLPFYLNGWICNGLEENLTLCQFVTISTCYSSAGVICQPASFEPNCTDNSTRLAGGSTPLEGRVEVCLNGDWGTISHDNWDYRDASVVCRQLEFSPLGSEAIHGGLFGLGSGAILLDYVQCIGHEEAITSCGFELPDRHDDHSKDAGVRCKPESFESTCYDGALRLDSSSALEGRLQVCVNGDWGTVSYDRWDYLDASVACRQLGFSPLGAEADDFRYGTGAVVLNNVQCQGDEMTLLSCPSVVPEIFATHYWDMGVRCKPASFVSNCTENSIRLVGGSSPLEGNVEVCINGDWGIVDHRRWDHLDASVTCRQLNFSSLGAETTLRSTFGRGSGPIVLQHVQCRGDELYLASCAADIPFDAHHGSGAGVRCQPRSFQRTCVEDSVRLAGGNSPLEGRVEVCVNGDWGTVSDSGWDNREASVVCRQLGLSPIDASAARFGPGTGAIVHTYTRCRGDEMTLRSCGFRVQDYDSHNEDQGARCQPTILHRNCSENSVRLSGGDSSLQGRVEVCVNGDWTMITSDGWDYRDAAVACKELGFSPLGAADIDRAAEMFGESSGNIALSNISCQISDTHLATCPSITGRYESTAETVGVQCQPVSFAGNCAENSARLTGGSSDLEGRVEVCVNGDWGTVTSAGWDHYDAAVVCRDLGHVSLDAVALLNAFFGEGTGAIVLDDVRCQGNETSLSSCGFTIPNIASHSEDAGVRCAALPCKIFSQELCTDNDLRLTGGATVLEGKLEVCLNATWGGVCHNNWNYRDAAVACRQLGFSFNGASALYNQMSELSFYLNSVICNESEENLTSCQFDLVTTCYSSVGVLCRSASFKPNCTENSTRLVGGSTPLEGRVEVCLNGDWGTISHDNWDYRDASVVCRQLEFSPLGSEAIHGGLFGLGSGAILLDYVQCMGHEETITSCGFDFPNLHDDHSKDAGVRCKPALFERACNESTIRLSDSYFYDDREVGRVQVCVNGDWGTVSYDKWDYLDASVACRQLGFSPLGAEAELHRYGSGAVVMNYVQCQGYEMTLLSCPHLVPDIYATHFFDVRVRCRPASFVRNCTESSVRLVGGGSSLEGNVEVCVNGDWGAIKHVTWDYLDASVTCRQLNFSSLGAEATIRSTFGYHSGPTVMQHVECRGDELLLTSCASDVPFDAYYGSDAGVRCQPGIFQRTCTEDTIRLAGGNSPLEGRVEVCVNGDWGTIGESGWNYREARVVCRQLGLSPLGAEDAMFGPGTGAIVHHYTNCNGNEMFLRSCRYTLQHYDSHEKDQGARCQPLSFFRNCTENSVRLSGGDSSLQGRVEVCVNGDWSMVTSDGWDYRDAAVTCRELGFSPLGAVDIDRAAGMFGEGSGNIALSNISCQISDTNLATCPSITSRYESTAETVGVQCQPASFVGNCTENATRLVGGSSDMEGRVELCVNGDWGTVTSTGWDLHDAAVVCRNLGHVSLGAVAFLDAFFREGTGAIVLDDVRCQGNETSLSSCGFIIPNIASHSGDAGVRCAAPKQKKIWFLIEPVGRNPYKLVFMIAKFAYKHKVPLRRSAFTYCEDELPPRMDLGKQKYGGPFTFKDVEDVKAFWGILKVVSCIGPVFMLQVAAEAVLPFFAKHSNIFKQNITGNFNASILQQGCFEGIARKLLLNDGLLSPLLVVMLLPLYLYFIRFKISFRIPSSLNRISLGIILITVSLVTILVMDVVVHAEKTENANCLFSGLTHLKEANVIHWNSNSSNIPLYQNPYFFASLHFLSAITNMLIDVAVLEFICSQSPYSMKGLLLGYFFSAKSLFQTIAIATFIPFGRYWKYFISCGSGFYSVYVILAVLEFILFLYVSKKYKYRKVDEPSNEYRYAEEHYSNLPQ